MTKAERILSEIEDRQDASLLVEMNGPDCGFRQFDILRRSERRASMETEAVNFIVHRRAAQRASRLSHRGFERARTPREIHRAG